MTRDVLSLSAEVEVLRGALTEAVAHLKDHERDTMAGIYGGLEARDRLKLRRKQVAA